MLQINELICRRWWDEIKNLKTKISTLLTCSNIELSWCYVTFSTISRLRAHWVEDECDHKKFFKQHEQFCVKMIEHVVYK